MPAIRFLSLFSFIVFSLSQSINGQLYQSVDADKLVKDSKLVRLNPKNKNIQFIQLRDDAKVEDKNHTIWLGKALKISQNHSYRAISKSTDQLGQTHSKYQLHYKNLPVEGAMYIVHSRAGKIVSANGDYTPGSDLSVTPKVSEPDAFEAAIKFVHAKEYRWEKEKSARPSDGVKIAINNKFDSDFIVNIYDNIGVLLKTLKKSESETLFDVDLSNFSAAIYIIRIYNSN